MSFEYSDDFRAKIVRLLRGKETWPNYQKYIDDHLGGPNSRVVKFTQRLCPEIEYRCGSLKDKRVLDFGCGTGASTAALAQYSEHVCAYDIDEESIDICRQRIHEQGLETRVHFFSGDFDKVKDALGIFDFILVNGVIEHIPLTKIGLRKKILNSIFDVLSVPGYLYINETPNRLWPIDSHSTQLWWIPWSKPGSEWAFRRAVKKKRHSEAPTISEGPLGLEEVGAWGATYWEIVGYLKGKRFVCQNTLNGYDRYIDYTYRARRIKRILETLLYYSIVKLSHFPISAFLPYIDHLVIMKI